MKTMEWIKCIEGELPVYEVIAIGYQNEMIIGYISSDGEGEYSASNDNELLSVVTHWMLKQPAEKPKLNDRKFKK